MKEQIESCNLCSLGEITRCNNTKPTLGIGSLNPKIFIIGEAPGQEEELVGKPFVGKSGQLLQDIILDSGLTIKDIYVTNAVKHRPPGNRTPTDEEITACLPYLKAELEMCKPKVIFTVGVVPAKAAFQIFGLTPPKKIRGYRYSLPGCDLLCSYHPAYVLRNPAAKQDLLEDLALAILLSKEIF